MGLPGFKPCQLLPDKPLGLLVKNLDNFWQQYSNDYLRRESFDPQICGYEYCTEGAACQMFLKYAPESVEALVAKWDYESFTWQEDNVNHIQKKGLPSPVKNWIDHHHGKGAGDQLEALCEIVGKNNDWRFSQIADLIRIHFQMGGDLLEQARRIKK